MISNVINVVMYLSFFPSRFSYVGISFLSYSQCWGGVQITVDKKIDNERSGGRFSTGKDDQINLSHLLIVLVPPLRPELWVLYEE